MSHKTALITGASGGIGYELSKLFATDGYNLVLVARNATKLEQLAADLNKAHNTQSIILPKDLSDPQSPTEIFQNVQSHGLQLDILVNNAGFGTQREFADTDLDEAMAMINLNIIALTKLTKLFLPGMLSRNSGRILNIGSTGSFSPIPLMAVYGATKAYVLSFSEALADELRNTNISVTAFCPGVTITGFQERAGLSSFPMMRLSRMTANKVARIAYQAMQHGKIVAVPGLFNQLMIFSIRFTPRIITCRLARWLMEA